MDGLAGTWLEDVGGMSFTMVAVVAVVTSQQLLDVVCGERSCSCSCSCGLCCNVVPCSVVECSVV